MWETVLPQVLKVPVRKQSNYHRRFANPPIIGLMTPGRDKSVSDSRLLVEFVLASDPAFFASELADNVPISRVQVNSRLDQLEEQGLVASKTASGRRLWWLTDDGRQRATEAVRDRFRRDD